MATWILRKVDDAFWARFKTRAASEGRGLRWIVLELIRHYTAHGLQPDAAQPENKSPSSSDSA